MTNFFFSIAELSKYCICKMVCRITLFIHCLEIQFHFMQCKIQDENSLAPNYCLQNGYFRPN